jgi:spore coat polysaccharide biosynthesis protein SpsF
LRTVVIIQARMGSTRLPGKIMMKVKGKTLLEYQLERVKRSKCIDEVIIATTVKEADDEIVEHCKKLSVSCFRGSEDDVLSRYYGAAKQYNAEVIVRLTSDCPIIDPFVIDQVISNYQQHDYDYVSNTIIRSYPRGMDVEVFSFRSLEESYIRARDSAEREHVTPYIYRNPSLYKLGSVAYKNDESEHRWTVDTAEDLALIRNIISDLYEKNHEFTLEDTLNLMREFPEWTKINAHIEQKKLEE